MFGHTYDYSHTRAQVLACSHTSALQKIKPDQSASTKCGHVFCYDCMSALCRRPGFPTAPGLIGLGFAVCAALCLGGKTVTLWKGLAYQRRAEKRARRVNLPHLQRGWTHPCCICTGTGSYAHTPPRLASARFFFPCRLAGTRVCRARGMRNGTGPSRCKVLIVLKIAASACRRSARRAAASSQASSKRIVTASSSAPLHKADSQAW